ncbi:amidohydrolase family protein [Kitasatospora sp. NPDC090091]|uniref:metal-dependent hydrolase family protein n=1 Tax=Kitasatospora sp. NPDC090091 TaxID=3364081 RepID=UPI003805A822
MNRLLITHAHLLHPEDGTRTEPSWLEVADGRIAATGTGRPPAPGEDVRVIDARGATVLPGLIDVHVHLLVTSLDLRDVADWTPGYATVRALAEAERMLRRGFTTVRDVGGADHGMARALAEGLVPGPRLVHGGKALSQTGGHGDLRPLGDDALPCCEARPHFGRIADGVDAVRAAARDEFRKGAAHLKVLLSGGVASPHDEIAAVQYSEEEIRAAVEEAENHNRYVTVHAYHPRAIDRALRAGVRCVEHGNLLDDANAALLRERDAFLVPTLVAYEQTAKLGAASGLPPAAIGKLAEVRDQGLAALERAHRAGVNLVYGSDLLGPLHPAQLEEFRLRAEVQPAADVIRSATVTAARLLGMAGEIGTLAPGAHADLLVVDGDPLADLAVLTRPECHLRQVIKAGVPV